MPVNNKQIILTQDFRELIENNGLYIDKTDIIYNNLLKQGKNKAIAIFRPRRWGKSLLLSLLRELYLGSKKLFSETWIGNANVWNWDDWHPIIYISFAGFSSDDNLQKYIKEIGVTLFVKEGGQIKTYQVDNLYTDFMGKIGYFSKYIYEQFGRKPVILVDEYDKVYLEGLNLDEESRNNNINIYSKLFSDIKDNTPYIELTLVTGLTYFAKTNLFSTMNHLDEKVLTYDIHALFGITQQELEYYFQDDLQTIANKKGISYNELLDKVKKFYNGYLWTKSLELNPEKVYNLWDILNFIDNDGTFGFYWGRTGFPSMLNGLFKNINIDRYLELLEEFEKEGTIKVSDIGLYTEINPWTGSTSIENMLLQAGYITIKGQDEFGLIEIGPANLECDYYITKGFLELAEFYGKTKEVDIFNGIASKITNAIYTLNNTKLEKYIKEALDAYLSFVSIIWFGTGNENAVKMFLASLFKTTGAFIVIPEPGVGYGQSDFIIESINNGNAYLIEVKSIDNDDKGIEKADNQIDVTYIESFKNRYGDKAKGAISINIYAGKIKGANTRIVKVNARPI